MNEITQYTDFSQFLTMAFAGIIMINMICGVIALALRYSKVLRVSGASFIASLATSWFSWLAITAFLPPKMMNAGWVAGIFFLCLFLVYILWLIIFQPTSLERMLKAELYQKQCLRINEQLNKCKVKLKSLDKNSLEYNNLLQEIKSLKQEKFSAKKENKSNPLKQLGKRICKSSK